ncbi:hypothetical protein ABPG73_007142 [Tetrahymena malaccensis]
MNLKIFLLIFSTLIEINKSADCPQLQANIIPLIYQGYVVKNFLRIPKTNVLVINTYYVDNQDSSIVYYNDMSSSSGEIINVIKPDYVIIEMLFNTQTDQLIISNYDVLIFADPYSLHPLTSFSIPYLSSIQLIKDTNYIILTNCYNTLQIFDFKNQKVILVMENTYELVTFQDNQPLYQFYSDIYKLKNGKSIIFTTNFMGVIAWGIDFTQLTYDFYGYIQDTQVKKKGDGIRSFTKHPTEDIIFVVGQNMQVLAVNIQNIELRQYTTLLNVQLSKETFYLQNIQFVNLQNNGLDVPYLWLGTYDYIYLVQLNIMSNFSTISLNVQQKFEIQNYYRWYTIEEDSLFFISSIYYITIFNYQTFEYTLNLYFYGDVYSRKFIRQEQGQIDRFILLQNSQVLLYDKGSLGQYNNATQKPQLSGNVTQNYGSFYQIKNIFDWYFMKSGENYQNSLIFIFPIYPLNQVEQVVDITSAYGLKWANINQNLDPFYFNNKIWVALGFPNKSNTQNYLFQLINCQSKTETYYLTSLQSDVSSIQTAYAIPSLEDPSNLELIGVDNTGTIYSWDLTQQNFPFKYSKSFSVCQNSIIGQVFQYQNVKKLIISCRDNNVYSFDLATGDYQFICKLSSQPLALRAFSNSQIIAIGDFNSGIAYIFKFNSKTFDFLLQLQSTQVQDKLIYIEMLNEQTIWIQYIQSNQFYGIKDCLIDSSLCTQCTQQYYFTATNSFDSNGLYGIGTSDNLFTTSNNFLTAMIKAQYYKQTVQGVSNMGVKILIQPDHKLNLNPNLMNFDFNSIISLNFQSSQPGIYASLEYMDSLTLQNYNQIDFQDIIIYFLLSQDKNSCGLILSNIQQGIVLKNIQLLTQQNTSTSLSCQSIYVDSSQLLVQQYNITQEDFTNHESIIKTFNSTQVNIIFFLNQNKFHIFKKIELQNFSLSNSTLGDNFSILQQQSNIQVTISNMTIKGNLCSQKSDQNNEAISVLFSAEQFNVKNMTIDTNIFCKKSIFSTISSLQQNQQVFSFSNISVVNNLFQARTTYLFFDAFYSMRAAPSHELNLNKIIFFNNSLIKSSSNDINTTSFFQTSKVANIFITDSEINNHFDIEFGSFENVITINITNFQCQNDDTYLANIPFQQSIGCFSLNEVYYTILTQIQVIKKSSQDSTLISLQNKQLQQSIFFIANGTFSDLVLNQTEVNTVAIPLYVISNYKIDMEIDRCIFQNIFQQSIQYTLTYSTTALWVVNYVGSVLIKNSKFLTSYSNSQYGQIYVQTNCLTIDTAQFNNSTFFDEDLDIENYFFSQGGMINAKASNINIINSNFSQATALKGSFLYLISFGDTFYLNFTNILFSEGFALLDGGAIFIDTNGQLLSLKCTNCQFSDIFSLFSQASTIGIQKYASVKQISQSQSYVRFYGGYIKNIFGILDNYFIDALNTTLKFQNISSISGSSNDYFQYAALVNLQNSALYIQNCSISNIQVTQPNYTFPLLINSQNSSITLRDMIIENLSFTTCAVYSISSQIQISNVKFININQTLNSNRLIQQNTQLDQSISSNSLIVAEQSNITINQNSIFSQIICNQNCNGGVLQVKQGILNINNTKFLQIQSTFGGAIFMLGMNQTNQISNSQFLSCSSQNDGGALYLYAFKANIYGQKWGLSFAKSAKFSCTRCDQIKGNIWIVVLMTVWTLISMCLAIKGNVDIIKEKVAAFTLQKNIKRKQTSIKQNIINLTDEDKSGIFIKMLTNYVQIVGSIATFNLSIPSGIFEFPQSVGQPLKQTMNSLDCALLGLNSPIPIIYLRLIFSLTIPVIYMIIFLFCMLFYYVIKYIIQFHGHLFLEEDEEIGQNTAQIKQESNTKICLEDQKEKQQQLENIIQQQSKQIESSIIYSTTPNVQDMDVNQSKIKEVRQMELIRLENQYTQQDGNEHFQTININFDCSASLIYLYEQQSNISNFYEGGIKSLQNEIIDGEQIHIELNQNSKKSKEEQKSQLNSS